MRSKSRIIQITQIGCNWTKTGEARTGQKAKPESVRSRSRSRAHKIRKQVITQTGFVQKLLTIFMKTRNENNLENSWTKTQEAGWNPNWFWLNNICNFLWLLPFILIGGSNHSLTTICATTCCNYIFLISVEITTFQLSLRTSESGGIHSTSSSYRVSLKKGTLAIFVLFLF